MRLILALALVLWSAAASAQDHYPLEITSPLPVGAVPNGLDADNRVYWAYPGLEYRIRTACIGGDYPYTYSLSGQPAGMEIVAGPATTSGPSNTAGTITWTPASESDDDVSITVRCTDRDGDFTESTWGIDVVASRFKFIDAVNGSNANAGTLASPWQTLSKAYDSSGANSICYFRTGTYTPAGITVTNADDANGEERVEWRDDSRCTVWIAYPGDSPVLDFEYTGTGFPYNTGDSVPRFRMSGETTWVEGLDVTRCMTMCFQLSRSARRGVMVYRNTIHDTGPGADIGGNHSQIMWVQLYGSGGVPDTQGWGDVVQNNTFSNTSTQTTLKGYSWLKALVADNSVTNSPGIEAIALKSDISQFTVRGNLLTDAAIGGNLNDTEDATFGEIAFNRVIWTTTGFHVGDSKVNTIGAFYVYRNTFVSPIAILNVATADGPYTYGTNVIVNSGGSGSPAVCTALRATCTSIADATRIVDSGTNLVGAAADSIVDANGNLVGSYRTTYLGTRGYELSDVAQTVPDPPTIGTATAGNAQASVTFTPPVDDGGATITGYTATSSPGSFTGNCSSSPCTVTGLTNGQAYTFTVTATNSVGTSSASSASNSVTPTAPVGTPVRLRIRPPS